MRQEVGSVSVPFARDRSIRNLTVLQMLNLPERHHSARLCKLYAFENVQKTGHYCADVHYESCCCTGKAYAAEFGDCDDGRGAEEEDGVVQAVVS